MGPRREHSMSTPIKKTLMEELLELASTSDASILKERAKEIFGDQFDDFVNSKILIPIQSLKSIIIFEGGTDITVDIQRMNGKDVYFSSADGFVEVSDDKFACFQINLIWLVRRVMDALGMPDRHSPKAIFEERIWAFGQHRIGKKILDIIAVRTIQKDSVQDALINYLNSNHKAQNPALVLSLDRRTPSHLKLPNQNTLIRIDEVIKWDRDDFELSTVLLAGKMSGGVTQEGFSGGFRSLVKNGKPYSFSKKQADVLEYLYNAGSPRHKDEILAEIGSAQRKLLELFKSNNRKHPAWGDIIKSDGKGYYWLDM